MKGIQMVFWAVIYEAYNLLIHPSKRYKVECLFCDAEKTARSYNMALTKQSLHVHFSEDEHPSSPDEYEGDWQNDGPEPERVN